jgi:radical SAM superfamily enzyme YgiQ (UPF0313 family)
MKESGCYLVSFGFESYSPPVLLSMKKRVTAKQMKAAVEMCHRQEMGVQGNFIMGDTVETIKTARVTLNYWKTTNDLIGNSIALGFILMYPGAAIYKYAVNNGFIKDEIDFVENHLVDLINVSKMTAQEHELILVELTMLTYHPKYIKMVTPKAVKEIDGVPEMHVKCPYCKAKVVYKNFEFEASHHMFCRECYKRYNVESLKMLMYKRLYFVRCWVLFTVLNQIYKFRVDPLYHFVQFLKKKRHYLRKLVTTIKI